MSTAAVLLLAVPLYALAFGVWSLARTQREWFDWLREECEEPDDPEREDPSAEASNIVDLSRRGAA